MICSVDKTATHADSAKPQRAKEENDKEERPPQDEGEMLRCRIKRSNEAAERRGDMRKEQLRNEVKTRMLAYSAKVHFQARMKKIAERKQEEQLTTDDRQEEREQDLWLGRERKEEARKERNEQRRQQNIQEGS